MKIQFNTAIPFQAKYIDDVNVMKYNPSNNIYEKSSAAFVELRREDKETVKALNNDWIKGILIEDIHDDFISDNGHKFYAVTTQENDYNNLASEKILAVGEISSMNGKNAYVEFLQAHPDCEDNPYFEYKRCGSAFSDGLKSIYKKIKLESVPISEVMDFYRRNGYIQDKSNPRIFTWEA